MHHTAKATYTVFIPKQDQASFSWGYPKKIFYWDIMFKLIESRTRIQTDTKQQAESDASWDISVHT